MFSIFFSTFCLVAIASSTPLQSRASTKIYTCGDSTMATWSNTAKNQGWGEYLKYSTTIPVVNKGVSGRSVRSYTDEGRFQAVANLIAPGDFVILEFGHNDGGSPTVTDNLRSACPGAGSETCTTPAGLIVQTFSTYLTNAAKLMLSKGARVIISSTTPNNPWETGSFNYSPGRFTTYAKDTAKKIGNGVSYVDHGQYVGNIYKTLGAVKVNSYFPVDHTHTSAAGAEVVSRAFIKSILCSKNPLASYVKNGTTSVQGTCI